MAASELKLIVPYPKDGGSDKRMRLLVKYLTVELGSEIAVTNFSGAALGHEAIARSSADGRTIGMISNEVGMMHWLGQSSVEPQMYTALALPYVEAAALIVRADSELNSVGDLLREIVASRIRGSGSPDYGIWKLALIGLLNKVGVDPQRLAWLPTVSGEEGLERVIHREADVAPVSLVEAPELIQQGKVRPLATMGEARHPLFPNVPTIREAIGVDWVMASWRGVVGPVNMPQEITERFRKALLQVSRNPSFLNECEREGYMLDWRHGADFARYMVEDDLRFGRLFELDTVRKAMVSH